MIHTTKKLQLMNRGVSFDHEIVLEPIVSNLPLQMALYFNAWFAPWWMIAHIGTLYLKIWSLSITYEVILVTIHIVSFIVEIVRIYLGYTGNLMEKIPELAGFWITTILLQLPLVSFLLLHDGFLLLPLDHAVDLIQFCFVLFEAISGFMTVRSVARHQVAKFHQLLSKSKHEKLKELAAS